MDEQEYLDMMYDTGKLIANDKATQLGNTAAAYSQSAKLVNDVEFWKWMGDNYPNNLANTDLIQQTAIENGQWLNTQLQGKGYEWDYMVSQRSDPSKLLSVFDAGDCPTQPGIDITETDLLSGKVKGTYQNKAYLSTANPNLHNTPKDAVVVTNREKVSYAERQGYSTESYMDADMIRRNRDSRYQKAVSGKAVPIYRMQNIMATSVKAGAIGAVIGMTTETVLSYRAWKNGELSDQEYLKEVLKAGGDSGVTAGATTAVMIPITAALSAAGASALLGIPIAFVLSAGINQIVAPCFGRGKYKQILNEAKYYQSLERVYDDFIAAAQTAADHYVGFLQQMQIQKNKYNLMKQESSNIDKDLQNLFESI